MKKIIPFLFVTFLVACDKDKFETKPQIEIDSYNSKIVGREGQLIINLKFTDKEGDLGEGKFLYTPKRLNRRPLPPSVDNFDTTAIEVSIPKFTDENNGEFEFKLPWNFLHKDDRENDTINFKFQVIDRAGNKSETVESDQVVILRQ